MAIRVITATLVALVATIGVLMSASAVGARPAGVAEARWESTGGDNNPKRPIQENNNFCGADMPALRVIGFVNYHRKGNVVKINWHFKDAMPNFTYRIELWRDVCTFHAVLGTITTNSNGVGNLTASVVVPPASTRFFATAFKSIPNPTFYDNAPAVVLLP